MFPADLTESQLTELHEAAMASAQRAGAGERSEQVAAEVMRRLRAPRPLRDFDHARSWVTTVARHLAVGPELAAAG
jgi:hypothetical protein